MEDRKGEAFGGKGARRTGFIAMSLLACAFVVLTVQQFVQLPLEKQVGMIPDDAFYYLGPALHISWGEGPTADGITQTSGFHPLWMGLLSGLAIASGGDREILLEISVSVSLALYGLAAWFLFLSAIRFLPVGFAVGWAALFLFGARGLVLVAGGTESALLAFLFALFLYTEVLKNQTLLGQIVRGVLLGLLFLARTDTVFFIGTWYCFQNLARYKAERNWSAAVSDLLLPAAITALIALSWFAICLGVYGDYLQQSMKMKKYWRELHLAENSTRQTIGFTLSMFLTWLKSLRSYPLIDILLVVLGGISILGRHSSRGAKPDSLQPLRTYTLALLVYLLAQGVYYSVSFNLFKEWYFMPAQVFWPVAGIFLTAHLGARFTGSANGTVLRIAVTATLVISVGLGLKEGAHQLFFAQGPPRVGIALKKLQLARWITKHVPANAIVGSYNSGTIAYFSGRPVVNLDGLANNDMLEVSQRQGLKEYLVNRGITHLADYAYIAEPGNNLDRDAGAEVVTPRLEELHRIATKSKYGDLVCWKLYE